jgi:hypothetical protein
VLTSYLRHGYMVADVGIENNILAIKNWMGSVRMCVEERERVQDTRLPGSCIWILQQEQLVRWQQDPRLRILWVHGILGCGKSFIFEKVLEHLDDQGVPTAFFVCSNSDDERNTAHAVFRSWIFQILQLFPENLALLSRFRSGNEHRSATLREVVGILLALLEKVKPVFLCIDGLDEVSDRGDLLRLVRRMPRKHKIFIASRDQNDIRNLVFESTISTAEIKIEPDCIKPDIESYVDERLSTDFADFDDHLKGQIKERLTHSCGSMFLWVRLMFESLLLQGTVEKLLESLDQLPDGLDDTYNRVVEGINRLPLPRRLLANKMLLWIVTVRRPLSVAELRTALAIQPGDETFQENRLVLNASATILNLCGPLVEVRQP